MAAQFIGSVISLVSKSDIRYQGVLHSIDPLQATVSLEKVRSLGTEGRKGNPAEEVPPSDTSYDFIVFRASDVKDLQIEGPAPEAAPSDPAIVGTAAPATTSPAQPAATSPPKPAAPAAPGAQSPFAPPPQQHLGGQSPFAPYPPPFPGSPFGAPSPFGPPGPGFTPYPPPPFGAPGPFGPGPFSPPGPGGFPGAPGFPPVPPPHQQQQVPPQGVTSPAPAPAQPAQGANAAVAPGVSEAVASVEHTLSQQAAPVAAPVTPNETRPETNGTAAASPKKQPADIEQLAKDMSRAHLGQHQQHQQHGQGQQQRRGGGRREDGVGASVFSGPAGGAPGAQQGAQQQRPRQLQPYGNAAGAPHAAGKTAVPVPDAEFDFAKANASFQKPSALPEAPAPAASSAAEETAAAVEAPAQDEFVVPPPPEDFYNPQKSFFDSISSDSKTRTDPAQQSAMGRYGGMGGGGYGGGRYDRAKERERNMDTFGESGAQLGRGGHRRGGGGGRRRQGGGGGQGGQQQQGGQGAQGQGAQGGGFGGGQRYGQRSQQQQQ
ncbi:hypothetical protein JCM3770_003247 [Rhodotorula araucariae]